MVTINPYLGYSKVKGYKKRKANEYNSKRMKRYGINVNIKRERSIVRWLEENKPYQTAIKRLIREEITKEKKEKKKTANL